MLKTNRIEGELTYSMFISKITLGKTILEKAKNINAITDSNSEIDNHSHEGAAWFMWFFC